MLYCDVAHLELSTVMREDKSLIMHVAFVDLSSTERYRCLPSPTHHLRFLELQLDLLDDFRVRLLQLMKLESGDPLAGRYAAILNGANYIISVLQEWSEQVVCFLFPGQLPAQLGLLSNNSLVHQPMEQKQQILQCIVLGGLWQVECTISSA